MAINTIFFPSLDDAGSISIARIQLELLCFPVAQKTDDYPVFLYGLLSYQTVPVYHSVKQLLLYKAYDKHSSSYHESMITTSLISALHCHFVNIDVTESQ